MLNAVEGMKGGGAEVGDGVRVARELWACTGIEADRAKARAPGCPNPPLLGDDDEDKEEDPAADVPPLRLWPTVIASSEWTPPRAVGEPARGRVYHSTAVMTRGSARAAARASPVPVRVRRRPVSRERYLVQRKSEVKRTRLHVCVVISRM